MNDSIQTDDLMYMVNSHSDKVRQENQHKEEAIVEAKRKSLDKQRLIKKRKEKRLKHRVANAIVTVVTISMLANGAINFGRDVAQTSQFNKANDKVMEMVYGTTEYGYTYNIVGDNTFRIEDGYAYKHDGIAKDLMKMSPELFEVEFASVCKDMNINLRNVVQGMSNIDRVIFLLQNYSKNGDSDIEKFISSEFKDVNTLDDYLIKKGYVDNKGNPSVDMLISAQHGKADYIEAAVNKMIEERGESYGRN